MVDAGMATGAAANRRAGLACALERAWCCACGVDPAITHFADRHAL